MSQCYAYDATKRQVFVLDPKAFVKCPSGTNCCGINDTCLSNNLCYFDHAPFGPGNYSGYYVATCTDPTYTDPSCSKSCRDIVLPDAVYNYTSQQWACCGTNATGAVTCQNPTTQLFSAPAPSALSTISNILISSTAGSMTTTSSSSATLISTTVTTAISSNSANGSAASTNSEPLSQGAKIGIGVGVAVAALLIILTAAFFVRRWHTKRGSRPLLFPVHEKDGHPRSMPSQHNRPELEQPGPLVLGKDRRYWLKQHSRVELE